MTERKPPEVTFESWIDQQIRAAEERGDFATLPGRGKPLPRGLDTASYDEQWWIKQKMAREGLSHLPPTLALRKEAEDVLAAAPDAPSEQAARRLVTDLNAKIREALRMPPPGPPLGLKPFDVDKVAHQWRTHHENRTT
ncbi:MULTISPECIES: DnaJ family domain-containing protein [Streptomyces]|uniref:DnaJ family domain-containing protein n=1 Tax=Streptomyces sp. SYP-A7185 TaxID=3040076 RepID=UPI0038F6CC3A